MIYSLKNVFFSKCLLFHQTQSFIGEQHILVNNISQHIFETFGQRLCSVKIIEYTALNLAVF